MENREAFMGISVETEESVEKVNWRQYNYNQRGKGNNRGNYNQKTMVLKEEVTKIFIIVVIAIQDKRQVTAVQYVR